MILKILLASFSTTMLVSASPSAAPTADALPPAPDRAKAVAQFRSHPFGMFIHFGLYSAYGGVYKGQPVKTTYMEQIMGRAHIPRDEFMATAASFDLAKFDAEAICRLAQEAGMTQIVITTKHHDGFCMFRTKQTPRNIVRMGPTHRDPIAELAAACAKHKLALGLYYSIIDWSEGSGFDWNNDNPVTDELIAYDCAQLKELLTQYGPVSQLWFDMGHPTPAQSRRLAETVWRHQPACAVNGRVWNEQGDFITLGDNQISKGVVREPCQSPASIEHQTWGYCSWLPHPMEAKKKGLEKAGELSRVVSHGGCYLLNIGPKGSGEVDAYERETLQAVGAWMKVNGEAVTGARAVDFFAPLPWGAATAKGNHLYLHLHDVSKIGTEGLVLPGLQAKPVKACVLGGGPLEVGEAGGQPRVAWNASAAPPGGLPVVEIELDGPPVVLPPEPGQPKPGVFALEPTYQRLNRNGAGYYHDATVRSVSYDFHLTESGQRQLVLRLGEKSGADDSLRVRVTAGEKEVGLRVIPVPEGVEYLDLGRVEIPAGKAICIEIAHRADAPGAILPVAPKMLYLVPPALAHGPAALWQSLEPKP